MYLGDVAPLPDDIAGIVDRFQRLTRARLQAVPDNRRLAAQFSVLSYADYRRALARFERHEQDIHRYNIEPPDKKAKLIAPSPALVGFIARGKSRARTPDEAGWRAYLDEVVPGFADEIASLYRPSAFPEVHRNRHTFIVAPTGQGKSELLKALIWHDVTHPGASVVVLDPGGDMCRQIARWPDLMRSDRLVYVEPELRPGFTVGINPFAGGHLLDDRGRSAVAGIIARTLGDLTADLSEHMLTLARYCAVVLLGIPDASLLDLGLLIQKPEPDKVKRSFDFEDEGDPYEPRRQEVLRAAFYHADVDIRRFFRIHFDEPEYLGTRGWLGTRIRGIGAKLDLKHALFGPDTLKLEQAMDTGKIMVVNLKRYGDERERADVGRLLVGQVAAIGDLRGHRDDTTRNPVHLIVDEATEMVSPEMLKILERLRKFGIHLTLAQQVGGRSFTSEQKEVLFQNTRTKIIAHESKREGAALLGFQGDADSLPTLAEFQFWVRWHNDPHVRHLAVRSDLADGSHSVHDDEWERFKRQAVGAYYRPSKAIPAPVRQEPGGAVPAPEVAAVAPPKPKRSRAASPMPPRPKDPPPTEAANGSAKLGKRLPKLP